MEELGNKNNDTRGEVFKVEKKVEELLESNYDMDEEEKNFVRILKKGSRKFKSNLPFKYFSCGWIGQFYTRFPWKEDNVESPNNAKIRDIHRTNNKSARSDNKDTVKKILCSLEDNSLEYKYENDSNNKALFLAIKKNNYNCSKRKKVVKEIKRLPIVNTILHAREEPRP